MTKESLAINAGNILNLLTANSVYYKNGKWFIEDGVEGKASTNGTWYYITFGLFIHLRNRLFLGEFFKLVEGITFRVSQTIFTAKITT